VLVIGAGAAREAVGLVQGRWPQTEVESDRLLATVESHVITSADHPRAVDLLVPLGPSERPEAGAYALRLCSIVLHPMSPVERDNQVGRAVSTHHRTPPVRSYGSHRPAPRLLTR
jgi:hypothetical protein